MAILATVPSWVKPGRTVDATTDYGAVEVRQTSLVESGAHYSIYPVEYDGDEILLDPSNMFPEMPYTFLFRCHTVFVVKRPDGALDFYAP